MGAVYSHRIALFKGITAASIEVVAGQVAVIRRVSVFSSGLSIVNNINLSDQATGTSIFYAEGDILSGGANIAIPDTRIILPELSITDISLFSLADVCLDGYFLSTS